TLTMRRLALSVVTGIVLCAPAASGATQDVRLVDAVKARDAKRAAALLHQHVDPNVRQPDGATALHWAAHWDDPGVAELLIAAGADVNAANDLGATPLWLACLNGSAAMVGRLLDAGANPNAALPSGETPLMTAARTGDAAAVK